MKAHRAPIICQACHQAPLFSAGETGEPGGFRDGEDFFRPLNPSLSGQRFLPASRTLRAARRTPAGCGVTKHVLVAHVSEPQDTDGVTELARFGSRFGDHVVANPEADVPELPDSPFTGRPERQFSAV
jgi:hypothetical protein